MPSNLLQHSLHVWHLAYCLTNSADQLSTTKAAHAIAVAIAMRKVTSDWNLSLCWSWLIRHWRASSYPSFYHGWSKVPTRLNDVATEVAMKECYATGMGRVGQLARRKPRQTVMTGMLVKSLQLPSREQVEKVLDYSVAWNSFQPQIGFSNRY